MTIGTSSPDPSPFDAALAVMLRDFGRGILADPQRVRAVVTDLLADDAMTWRSEIDALAVAGATGVATRIAERSSTTRAELEAELVETGVAPGAAAVAVAALQRALAPEDTPSARPNLGADATARPDVDDVVGFDATVLPAATDPMPEPASGPVPGRSGSPVGTASAMGANQARRRRTFTIAAVAVVIVAGAGTYALTSGGSGDKHATGTNNSSTSAATSPTTGSTAAPTTASTTVPVSPFSYGTTPQETLTNALRSGWPGATCTEIAPVPFGELAGSKCDFAPGFGDATPDSTTFFLESRANLRAADVEYVAAPGVAGAWTMYASSGARAASGRWRVSANGVYDFTMESQIRVHRSGVSGAPDTTAAALHARLAELTGANRGRLDMGPEWTYAK